MNVYVTPFATFSEYFFGESNVFQRGRIFDPDIRRRQFPHVVAKNPEHLRRMTILVQEAPEPDVHASSYQSLILMLPAHKSPSSMPLIHFLNTFVRSFAYTRHPDHIFVTYFHRLASMSRNHTLK